MKTQPLESPPIAPPQAPQFEEPRRPLLPLLLTVATIVVGGAVGWLLGGALRHEPTVGPPPAERIANVGPLLLKVDAGWAPVAASAELAKMGVKDLAPFAPVAGLPGRAWLARADADGPTLVPAGVRARLAKPLGKPQSTRLAGNPAWSYGAVPLRSGGQLELTVQPLAAGVLVVGCEATKTWWSTVGGCTRAVREMSGGTPVAPAADLAFRQRAGAVVATLNRERAAAAKALAGARKRTGQRAAARRLVAAHAKAAAALDPLAPPQGPARAAIVRLRAAAGAYHAVARAARVGSRKRYRAARKQVATAESKLRTALRRATA